MNDSPFATIKNESNKKEVGESADRLARLIEVKKVMGEDVRKLANQISVLKDNLIKENKNIATHFKTLKIEKTKTY